MSFFGKKQEGSPEELSDLTTADVPKSKYETGQTTLAEARMAAEESTNAFMAALNSIEGVLDMRSGVHLYQMIQGKPVVSQEGAQILKRELNKRITLLAKTFEGYLADQADLELFEDRERKRQEEEERNGENPDA